MRKFEDYPAAGSHKPHPLLVGITGPSFSGKSFSAGRLALGMLRVTGGAAYWIDTENDRALELDGPLDFSRVRHVPFPRPESPAEYLGALEHCLAKLDCGVIIFDQMSHEHVAVLQMMEDFLEKRAGDDFDKRERLLFAAMVKPKAERKRLNERLVYGAIRKDGRKVPIILLYRAQDKTKPGKSKREGGDGKPVHKGWQAETTSDLPYYMTVRFLLPPASDGHPNLTPDTEWEKLEIKNPGHFREWFKPGFQLTEEIGEKLARWAMGGGTAAAPIPEGDDDDPAERVRLLGELRAALAQAHPADAKARQAALRAAVGTHLKAEVEVLPLAKLRAGLASLVATAPEAAIDPTDPLPEGALVDLQRDAEAAGRSMSDILRAIEEETGVEPETTSCTSWELTRAQGDGVRRRLGLEA